MENEAGTEQEEPDDDDETANPLGSQPRSGPRKRLRKGAESNARIEMDRMQQDYDELAEAKAEDDFDNTELHRSWGVTDKQSVRAKLARVPLPAPRPTRPLACLTAVPTRKCCLMTFSRGSSGSTG